MVFHVSRLVFNGFSWLQVCFYGFSWFFGRFSWFFMVPGWFFIFHVGNTLKLYSGPTIQSWPCRPYAGFGLVSSKSQTLMCFCLSLWYSFPQLPQSLTLNCLFLSFGFNNFQNLCILKMGVWQAKHHLWLFKVCTPISKATISIHVHQFWQPPQPL